MLRIELIVSSHWWWVNENYPKPVTPPQIEALVRSSQWLLRHGIASVRKNSLNCEECSIVIKR